MSFSNTPRYLFALLIAVPAFAQESGGGAEKPSLLLWQVLNFFILAGLIGWLVAKHGGPFLAARAKTISEGLAAGTRAKAEADARAAEVQKKLGNLEQEVNALRTTALEERARETDRIRRETQAEIVRIQYQANVEIESAGKQARLDVQRAAAVLAIQLAEKKVLARMSPDVQSSLLQSFLKDLANGPARSATAA
jgi:F-type H+-transporting ATPase subunit b